MPKPALLCYPDRCDLGIDVESLDLSKAEKKHVKEYHANEPLAHDQDLFTITCFRQPSEDLKYQCLCGNTFRPSSSLIRHINQDGCEELSGVIQDSLETKTDYITSYFHINIKSKKTRTAGNIDSSEVLQQLLEEIRAMREEQAHRAERMEEFIHTVADAVCDIRDLKKEKD
ncbi:hypothetical protein BGX27_005058, partial [Mortierella sp. AM989]